MDEGTKAPPEFFCPISNELMRDPVTTTDGHCYERQSLIKWFEEHKDAADCMNPPTFEWMGKRTEPLGSSTTTNNMMLQRSILRWEERYSKVLQRKSLTPVECTPPHSPSKTFCSATKIGVGSFKEVHRSKRNKQTHTKLTVSRTNTRTHSRTHSHSHSHLIFFLSVFSLSLKHPPTQTCLTIARSRHATSVKLLCSNPGCTIPIHPRP